MGFSVSYWELPLLDQGKVEKIIPFAFRYRVVPNKYQIDSVADPWNESQMPTLCQKPPGDEERFKKGLSLGMGGGGGLFASHRLGCVLVPPATGRMVLQERDP